MLDGKRCVLVCRGVPDVEQTSAIGRNQGIAARRTGRRDLVAHHRTGDIGLLQRERSAESAALGFALMLDSRDARQRVDERDAVRSRTHFTARRARCMKHDALGVRGTARRCGSVIDLQYMQQELAEFVDSRGDIARPAMRCRIVGKKIGPMMAHHARARAGRYDDGPRLIEETQLCACDGTGLFGVAAAIGGLSAAALAARKMHCHALPFEQPDGVEARVRNEQVDEAGREQINVARPIAGIVSFLHCCSPWGPCFCRERA